MLVLLGCSILCVICTIARRGWLWGLATAVRACHVSAALTGHPSVNTIIVNASRC